MYMVSHLLDQMGHHVFFVKRSTYPWLSVANRFKVGCRDVVVIPFYLIRPELLEVKYVSQLFDTF